MLHHATVSEIMNPLAFLSMPHDDDEGATIIATRFGNIRADLRHELRFPRGLLGMPDRSRFTLVEFPSEKMSHFRLLQSIDDLKLSFISLPLDSTNAIIAREDLENAAHELGIDPANMVTLLIVSVQRTPGKVRISVNARAPLFIDVRRRVGFQHVFLSDRYAVQHTISE